MRLPAGGRPRPPVDDHIAPPETRVEYLNGIELFASPAKTPHARKHADLTYVLGAHTARGYASAVDMLTRTGEASDFAPDASVFPEGRDPETGGRRIEELAFEVSDRQALSVPTEKARQLIERGVRRVFCLLVKHNKVMEWSRALGDWELLPRDAVIDDPALVRPMPVRALMEAAGRDDAVAEALLEKGVPALDAALARREAAGKAEGKAEGRVEGKAEGKVEGRIEGKAEGEAHGRVVSILAVLAARGIALSPGQKTRIETCVDRALLDEWLTRAATANAVADVLEPPPRKRRVRTARRG